MTSSKIGSGRSMSFSCRSPTRAELDALTEVAGDDRARRVRQEHLAARAGGRDPRGANDVQPGIALVADRGLARVEPETDAHLDAAGPRAFGVGSGDLDRRGHRLAGAHEGVEERVALGVDLLTLVRGEDLAHQPAMDRQELSVLDVAQLLEQCRAAGDVAEDESDRSRR